MKRTYETNYWNLEKACEEEYHSGGPYWHICTDGNFQKDIFLCDDEFKIAMNCMAFCILEHNIKLIAFVIMNNHVHFIIEGTENECLLFFNNYRKRLKHCFSYRHKSSSLDGFECNEPIAVTSLQQLRNEIVYIHRNPFVARQDTLPYNYQWSSGCLYFNEAIIQIPARSYSKLTYKEKRALHSSSKLPIPESFRIRNGLILPESIIDISRCERYFRHASHYFFSLTKNLEAYSEVSQKLGDNICLNDEEVFSAASLIAKNKLGVERLNLLVGDQSRIVAIELHNKYKACNKQISRILKLSIDQLNLLFPQKE